MKLRSGDSDDLKVDDVELGRLLEEIHAPSPHQQHPQQHQLQYNPAHIRLLRQYAQSGRAAHAHGNGSSLKEAIFGAGDDEPSSFLGYPCPSPVSGVSIQSSTGSLSGGLSPDDATGSPSPPAIEYPTPLRTQYADGLQEQGLRRPDYSSSRNDNNLADDELGLAEKLWKMNIRNGENDAANKLMPLGNAELNDWALGGGEHGNVVMKSGNDFSSVYDRFGHVGALDLLSSDEEMRKNLVRRLQQSHQRSEVGYLPISRSVFPSQLANNQSYSGRYMEVMSDPWNQTNEYLNHASLSSLHTFSEDPFGGNYCRSGGVHASEMENFVSSRIAGQNRIDFGSRDMRGLDPLRPSSYVSTTLPNSWAQPCPLMRRALGLEAFTCEGNLIIQGKDLNYGVNGGLTHPRESQSWQHERICNAPLIDKNYGLDGGFQSPGNPTGLRSLSLQPMYLSLAELRGNIYLFAKDQHGCRFLQQKFDEGNPQDVQIIFNEIVDYVVELMMNSFGNYLIQKLLDVCNERQRMQILIVVTRKRGELVRISLNTHGTRAVQKLIETLKNQEQISLVTAALEPGFLALIKDLNGNHVLQRCLQCFSVGDNKFIFDAATKYCVEVATHRHGCCVLQRCIGHSSGDHRDNLVAEISSNGLLLAQDPFGASCERLNVNYVVQYILEQIPSAAANLASQFDGNYVLLSMQKFSSNVVEKCLKYFDEDYQSRIIHELLSTPHFDHLLQDPYANYVIYSALTVSKVVLTSSLDILILLEESNPHLQGHLHLSLVERIRPHAADLRTNPYCKRIFSKALLKRYYAFPICGVDAFVLITTEREVLSPLSAFCRESRKKRSHGTGS
ncbi:hypothetical protein ACLOJK_013299 [Asimina triloba]